MSNQRVSIPGSEPEARFQQRWVSDVDPSAVITATVMLRRRSSSAQDLLSGDYHPASRAQAEEELTASPEDVEAARVFAEQHGIKILDADAATRRVRIEGAAKQMEDAFGVQIGTAEDASGHRFITYKGAITLPSQLSNIVVAVLGLDQRPVARHAGPDAQ
jgi:kumamolisin